MAVFETWLNQDLQKPLKPQVLDGSLFTQDNMGNQVGVILTNNGEPANVSGTVSGTVIRADGASVAVDDGQAQGNRAWITLPQAAYAVPGQAVIVIKVTDGETVTTVGAAVAYIQKSTTDAIVDPGTIISGIDALIAEIEAAVDSVPADYSDLLHTLAPDYSTSGLYNAGDYTWHEGTLYRNIVPVTAPESWTAAHWAAANLGRDVSTAKDAAKHTNGFDLSGVLLPANLYREDDFLIGLYMVVETGAWYASSSYRTSGLLSVVPGRALAFYSGNGGTMAARNLGAVTAFDKNLNVIPAEGKRNVMSYTPAAGTCYVRITISNSNVGTENAIYQADASGRYPVLTPENVYELNGLFTSGLKWAFPISSGLVTVEEEGGNLTLAANVRFVTSDNELITVNSSITFEMPQTLVGVAIDRSGNLRRISPTAAHYANQVYFIAMWYGGVPIFDPCKIYSDAEVLTADNGFVSGTVFAWIANKKLYFFASTNTRLMYKGVSQGDFTSAISTAPVSIDVPNSASINYVYYNESGLGKSISAPADALVLGWVYDNQFNTNDPRIIANHLPVLDITQRADVPTYMNFRRLGYRFVPSAQNGNDATYAFFGSSARITNAYGNSNMKYVWAEDDNLNPLATTRTQNTTSLTGKKILTVGDSITARGWYQHFIGEVSGAEFVGTRTSMYYNQKCEGYSGRNAAYIFGEDGPFWNASAAKMDFAYYCTQNNIAPDIVFVMLGLNESETPQEYFEYIQAFVDDVKAYDSSIHVFVGIPFGEAYKAWYGAGVMLYSRFKKLELIQCQCYGLTDCTLVPCYYAIDDDTDYAKHSVAYGVGELSFDIIDDGVHPDENTGFKKIANVIYNYLQ